MGSTEEAKMGFEESKDAVIGMIWSCKIALITRS